MRFNFSNCKFLLPIATLFIYSCSGDPGNTPIEPSIPNVGHAEFKPNTYLFKDNQLADSTFTDNILIVKKPQEKIYKVGDIFVLDGHGGRLLKVLSIEETRDYIKYTTENAVLTDAFSKLSVNISGELTPEDIGTSFSTGTSEIEISWINPNTISKGTTTNGIAAQTNTLQINYKRFGLQKGNGIEINGYSSFTLNPNMSLNFKDISGSKTPFIEMSTSIAPDLKTSVIISSEYGGQISYTADLGDIELPSFRRVIIVPVYGVPVPVPFWIKPVIKFTGALNGVAGSKFSTTQNYSISGSLGLKRSFTNGWENVSSANYLSNIDVADVESELGINLTAPKVELSFLIYSVAGPNFDLGLESGLIGTSSIAGVPPVEGVDVIGSAKVVANAGLKAGLNFKEVDAVKKYFGDVSLEYTPISLKILNTTIENKDWFFPYAGIASITVQDNGLIADDVFEVFLDGVSLGKTHKGGSGQFRIKNIRPGERILTIKTVEDDSPPGTYEVLLTDNITFLDGSTWVNGALPLGESIGFKILVPN